jgi:hypothetical protein
MARPTGLPFTPLVELLREPPEAVRWCVEGRLPAGGLSLLAGKPKAGKSTLARCLALAVARGAPWIGWATTAGPVLYLALEEKRAEVRAHFEAMGATDEDVRVLVAQAPEDGLLRLREAADRVRPTLIIVDPLFRFVRVRDANDYAELTRALEPLLALGRETGAHVLVVHHLGKGERTGGDAILGSTAIFGAVDSALLLRRAERYRTLATIQRYGDDLDEITLALDPASRVVTAGPSRQEADQATAAAEILAFLATQGESVEEAAVHDAVESRRGTVVHVLRELVRAGQVVRSGAGRRGEPYRYRRASDDPLPVSGSGGSPYSPGTRNAKSELTPENHTPDSGSRLQGTRNGESEPTPDDDRIDSGSRLSSPVRGPEPAREPETGRPPGAGSTAPPDAPPPAPRGNPEPGADWEVLEP